MNIKLIKFANGEEIIVDVDHDGPNVVKFKYPIRLVILPPDRGSVDPKPKIAFDQWIPYLEDKEFTIDKNNILFILTPIAQLKEQYELIRQALDPKAIVPVKSKLILPN